MEWSEQGMRLSPFDSWAEAAFDAQAMSHLLRGRYEESCLAAYKSVQANPAHSITHTASLMCGWPPHSPDWDGWTKRGPPPLECSSFTRPFATAASLLV
jgi:hypothetical protein